MEWTRERRYERLEHKSADFVKKLQDEVAQSPWRFGYHIQPPIGLLNDPNGLVYHLGQYHAFYQWFPLGPVHGLKYWYHVTSTDLVHWEVDERQIIPNGSFDSHGAYSGSAYVINDEVQLFYTGNVRDDQWQRIPYQLRARMTPKAIIKDTSPLLSGAPKGYTDHFRDPKIWQHNNMFYMIIGAQTDDQTGAIVLYDSVDGNKWQWKGEVKIPHAQHLGYMLECPDLFTLAHTDVLLFCPQGAEVEDRFNDNIYLSGYLVGQFKYDTCVFETTQKFALLDHGFDFYAPQTCLDEHNQRILIGWMGLPEIDYPTDQYMWAHALTIPRVLTYEQGTLRQRPIKQLQQLRLQPKSFIFSGRQHELVNQCTAHHEAIMALHFDVVQEVEIALYRSATEVLILRYHHSSQRLELDRSGMQHRFAQDYGEQRYIYMSEPLRTLHWFRDTSSIELFINDGLYTMTSRFFPAENCGDIVIEATDSIQIQLELYQLKVTNK